MRAPSRSRRIAKWAGLVVCIVILAMWLTSVLRPTMLFTPFGGAACINGVLVLRTAATSDFPHLEN